MKKKKNRAPKQGKINSLVRCFVKPFRACNLSGWIYDADNMHALDVRGWGRLTGTGGGLGIQEDEAAEIQDAFQQHVVDALNAYKDFDPNDMVSGGAHKD